MKMKKCQDCILEADPRYTLDFTDVEPDTYIYFCAVHGPTAHKLQAALEKAFAERPDFAEILEMELNKYEN